MSTISSFRTLSLLMLSLIFIVPASNLSAQEDAPITVGKHFVVKSRILDQDRTVWLYLPDSYDRGDQAYPVLYMTDAEAQFFHFTGIVHFQARVNRMPEMIIVALTNIDRTHDLSSTPSAEDAQTFANAGGADQFLRFISDELIPYIEKNYRTQPYRIHVGHSLGGLFVGHSFLTDPNLFDAYVSISPAFWWNDNETIKRMDELLSGPPLEHKFFYLTVGNEPERMMKSAQDMADVFARYPDQGVKFAYKIMENEDHGSITHRTLYDALELLYEGWQFRVPPELADQPSLQLIDEYYANLSNRFGYTIPIPEDALNQLGYIILGRGRIAEAIEVFEANASRHPKSANVYDSLGDGYTAAGQLSEALDSYKKAVKLGRKTNHPAMAAFRANLERTRRELKPQ